MLRGMVVVVASLLLLGPVAPDETSLPVVRVVDGDTLVVAIDGRDQRVRLLGADAPETDEHYGPEATTFLTNLLAGERVVLHYEKSRRDRYGRLLAYVGRAPDGLSVNGEVVRQGYGRVHRDHPFGKSELFGRYEARARAVPKGLWRVEGYGNTPK